MAQKHFNSYKEGLDLDFVRQYCLEHGEVKTFKRGELLEKAGEVSQWIAYIESGYFKYMANEMGGGKKCAGFAFEGEFVANYPFCLEGELADLSIEAGMPCRVIVIKGTEMKRMYDEDIEKMRIGMQVMLNLFEMVYERYLDFYRYDAKERYKKLFNQCPQVVQQLPLKDIASFLNITPTHLSAIRKEITFDK